MKNTISKMIRLACGLMAVGMISIGAGAYAGPGPQALQHITTPEQASALKPGSTFAMTCAKCKTVLLQNVDKSKGILSWFTPKATHQCPGCGGALVYTEHAGGKGYHGKYVHTCSKCGDASAFCCGSMGGMKM